MSRSNLDKPFYVDVGTSIVAVRCASNHDVVLEYDHARMPYAIELAEKACDRMNREAETRNGGDCAKLREALLIVKKLFDGRIMWQPAIRNAHKAVNAALEAPATTSNTNKEKNK